MNNVFEMVETLKLVFFRIFIVILYNIYSFVTLLFRSRPTQYAKDDIFVKYNSE